MFNKLVPKKVTHNDFWARYLFKLEISGNIPSTSHVETPKDLEISSLSSKSEEEKIDKIENSDPSDPEVVSLSDATEKKKVEQSEKLHENLPSSASSDIDDWEKDLDIDDIDITEEEMAKALEDADKEEWDIDLEDI